MPSAVVVGTFAPDCEYFLRLAPHGGYGHTLAGALLLSLPLGLVVLWLFHGVVKAPATKLLPRGLQERLAVDGFGWDGRIVVIASSVLVGIATHIVWDSLTHRTYWPYAHWPLLRHKIPIWSQGTVPLYQILQHVSTLVGVTILGIWLRHWWRGTARRPGALSQGPRAGRAGTAVALLAIATVLGAVRGAWGAQTPYKGHVIGTFAGEFICTFVAALWWQLVLLGLVALSRRRPASLEAGV